MSAALTLVVAAGLAAAGAEPVPTSVALSVRVVPGEDTVASDVVVALRLAAPRRALELDGVGLQVEAVEVLVDGQPPVPARATWRAPHTLVVSLDRPVGPGEARLHLRATAPLSRTATDGVFQREGMAFTHFEPDGARAAFPCFDEPRVKVPWSLTLHVRREHQAFANSPVEATTDEPDGMKAVRFAATSPLPAYLVAFAVGPFEVVEGGRWGRAGTPLRVVTPPGRAAAAAPLLAHTGALLEALEAELGLTFPYPKLDQVLVPAELLGMENPGLITWGDQLPTASVPLRKVIAHELGHHWFGDLVTIGSWDELWLKETLASWASLRAVERAAPLEDWELWRVVRRTDELEHDLIGPAWLASWADWLGEARWRAVLQRYLLTKAHAVATSQDFAAALEQEGGPVAARAYRAALRSSQAPLVRATLRCPVRGAPSLQLSGEGVLPVPVCARFATGAEPGRVCGLLSERGLTLSLPTAGCPAWVLPNDRFLGRYRARLEGARGVADALRGAGVSAAERVGLLDELGTLVAAGHAPGGEAAAIAEGVLAAGDAPAVVEAAQRLRALVDGRAP